MFRSLVARCGVGLVAAALAGGGGAARAAEPAFDNASDRAYGDGWQGGDNGGFGFLPWVMTSTGGTAGVGSSTANGDAKAPAGDIDSAGRTAWWVSTKPSTLPGTAGSIEATRRLTGALGVGQVVSFDLDGYPNTANADVFQISLGNADGARWRVVMDAFFTRFDDGVTPGGVKLAPLTFEGIHVDVTLTGPDSLEIAARVLGDAEPVVVHAALTGAAGSPIDRITFADYPSLGSVDAFYVNNLAVTPEPGGVGAGLFGAGLLARRPWRARSRARA